MDTDGSCVGVLALCMEDGTLHRFRAHRTILATGAHPAPHRVPFFSQSSSVLVQHRRTSASNPYFPSAFSPRRWRQLPTAVNNAHVPLVSILFYSQLVPVILRAPSKSGSRWPPCCILKAFFNGAQSPRTAGHLMLLFPSFSSLHTHEYANDLYLSRYWYFLIMPA